MPRCFVVPIYGGHLPNMATTFLIWQVLPLMWAHHEPEGAPSCSDSVVARLEARQGAVRALLAGVAYAAGGPLAGAIGDKWFVRRRARL